MPYTTVVAGTTVTSSWANTNVRDQVITPFTNAAARTSAIGTPVQGMVSYLSDVKRFEYYNGTAWQPTFGTATKVMRTNSQIFGAGQITVEWQTEIYDDLNAWTAGLPTRLTPPFNGIYGVSATVSWDSASMGSFRRIGIYKNNVMEESQVQQINNTADLTVLRQNISSVGLKLVTTDYLEIQVSQDSGALRSVDSLSNFKLVYLGPSA